MSAGAILAIGVAVAAALGVALVAARRAGGEIGPEARYGHELDAPPRAGTGRRRPDARTRVMLAIIAGALAALGAGLATGLSQGGH